MSKLFNVDTEVGRHTVAHDDGDGGLILETKQDISEILEANKRDYNSITSVDRWGDLTHIARIPYTVIDDLNKKGIMRGFAVVDEGAFASFLNNPENRFLRVRPGNI